MDWLPYIGFGTGVVVSLAAVMRWMLRDLRADLGGRIDRLGTRRGQPETRVDRPPASMGTWTGWRPAWTGWRPAWTGLEGRLDRRIDRLEARIDGLGRPAPCPLTSAGCRIGWRESKAPSSAPGPSRHRRRGSFVASLPDEQLPLDPPARSMTVLDPTHSPSG